jgi:alpha-beta hydrolase superfamily lysophospholipase
VRPRTGRQDGLAYALWLPPVPEEPRADDSAPNAGLVIIHGAGSVKESHYDFARAAIALGFAALTFDQRGHGESEGRLDGRGVSDVIAMARLLRQALSPGAPVGLRGSSLGGYLALRAARGSRAGAVVAISPASPDDLRRALRNPELPWRTDPASLSRLLDEEPLAAAVSALTIPVLFMHAQGDEQVPVELSRELAAEAGAPGSRLIEVPGGHHRSVQHDEELQAVSLRFLQSTLGLRRGRSG